MGKNRDSIIGPAIVATVLGGFLASVVALLASKPFHIGSTAEGYVFVGTAIPAGLLCGFLFLRNELGTVRAELSPGVSRRLASRIADSKTQSDARMKPNEMKAAQVFGKLVDLDGTRLGFGALTLTHFRIFFVAADGSTFREVPLSVPEGFRAEISMPIGALIDCRQALVFNPQDGSRPHMHIKFPNSGDAEFHCKASDAVLFGGRQDVVLKTLYASARQRVQATEKADERKKAKSRGPRPKPLLVRDAQEAEEMAAGWVRWMGWPNATRTQSTGDGGIDVIGQGKKGKVVAQVKFEALPAGRPVLQALFGAGHGEGATHWIFISSAGYTAQALAWAEQVGMALFRFSLDGSLEPVNEPAGRLF